MMDLHSLHASIDGRKTWTPPSMCVEVCDGPGAAAEKKTIDMIKVIPNEPNQSLKYGKPARV